MIRIYFSSLLTLIILTIAFDVNAQKATPAKNKTTAVNVLPSKTAQLKKSWVKQLLVPVRKDGHSFSLYICDTLLYKFQPLYTSETSSNPLVCGVPGIKIIVKEDPWKPTHPTSIFDFL